MAEDGGQERTEAATPKRKQDARKRGQVARSTELPPAISLLAAVLALRVAGPLMWERLSALLRDDLARISRPDLTTPDALALARDSVFNGVLAILPIVLTMMITGTIAGLVQTGLVVSPRSLAPKFSRVNPMAGFKRIFSMTAGFELLKMLIRLTVLGSIAYSIMLDLMPRILMLGRNSVDQAPALIGDIGLGALTRMAFAGGILATVDYSYQRWRFGRELRMTKQEIKEELKQQEGDPAVKSRIRRIQRELARKRMMDQVPKSTAVITNPTHYAVAIRYIAGKTRAPIVVAKGQDNIAQQIKALARKHNIPIVENPPLARALHASVSVDQEIPAQLYRAVAEVLAFVYRIKRRW
jgi:flagellar biosynthetic protein FlhB